MKALKILIFFCVVLAAANASAVEVRVFKPMEEGMSPMQLRQQALAEGFAQAVTDQAVLMLPTPLGEARTGLLQEYMIDHSQQYIQGYRVVGSEAMDAGLILRLDVTINKPLLRQGMQRMGLFATLNEPLAATIAWPEDLVEESVVEIQKLMKLTGIQQTADSMPFFSVEAGSEQVFKARLVLEDREWVTMGKDLSAVWYELWAKYFSRSEAVEPLVNRQHLTVSGWFTADAALEFDRVLRGWDSAVQEVELVEMDMQTTGIGAIWSVRLLNAERLRTMLDSFLPQRGLSYQLSGDSRQ